MANGAEADPGHQGQPLRVPSPDDVELLRGLRIGYVSSSFGTPRHTCQHGREQLARFGLDSAFMRIEQAQLQRDLDGFDLLILNRVPATPELEAFLVQTRGRGIAVLGDLDDMLIEDDTIFSQPGFKRYPPAQQARLRRLSAGLRATFAHCSHVVCYSDALQTTLSRCGHRPLRTTVCASREMIDRSLQAVDSVQRDPDLVTIGFVANHPAHAANLEVASAALAQVLQAHANVRLALFGGLQASGPLEAMEERIVRLPSMDWRELPKAIRSFDLAIAPLGDNAFNAGKSHLKYVDAGLCQVPLVASPVGQLAQTVRDGVTGLLATDTEQWYRCIKTMVESAALRESIGARAQLDILSRLTTATCASGYVQLLARAVRESRAMTPG